MKIPNSPCFEISIIVHNLMINPNDLPTKLNTVFNEKGEKVYLSMDSWYYEDGCDKLEEPPKLWYDIPQFDVERIELEKLSKEELIELIIKERGEK